MRRVITLLIVVLIVCAGAQGARGDGVADEAEVNFRLGTERYQAGDFRAALAYFLASNRLAPNRHVRFNIARAFQRLGEYPEAYRWCSEALEGESDPDLRARLLEALSAIEREVALVVIDSSPPGATAYLDRRDLGSIATTPARMAVREGEHRMIFHLDGYEDVESAPFQAVRGQSTTLKVTLRRLVGHAEVDADAPTEVRVDHEEGALACTAPCKLELVPGFHQLFFRRRGFRVRTQPVQIEAGKSARVRAEATALTGSLLVTAEETGAEVQLDGVSVGFTPAVVRNVPVGVRRVRVGSRGFQAVEQTVEIRENEQTAVRDLVLVPSREVTAASRVRQSIDEAPASVSIITPQELEAFRYPTIYEALRGQRGIALADDGVYAGLSVRGLGQPGDYGNRLLVLSDGATLNDNILWQSYVGYDGRVDLDDLERIELVRGPGSVLYGTGAVSGVVNLIPRAPPEQPFVEARVSAIDPRTARARVAGGLPLKKRGGLTLSAAGAHGEGQSLRLPDRARTYVEDVRAFDAATAQARLVYRDLTVQAFATTRKQEVPQGAYGALVGHARNELIDTRALGELRYEPRLGERVRLYTRLFGNVYRFEARQAYPGEVPGLVADVDERYRGVWFGAEGRVVAALTGTLELSTGAELQLSPEASLRGESREAGQRERYLSANESYQTYAGYALLEWAPARWLTLSAGARLDAWSTFGVTVNPRASLVLRPTERDVLKLWAGRAFRAPSIYELRYTDGGTTQLGSDYQGNELKPELVWSGELEYTRHLADGWSLLGAAHLQRAERFIMQRPTDPGDPDAPVFYDNGASTLHTYGADLELKRDFRAGYMFAASYGALRARYSSASAGGGSTRVPNTPSHYASARAVAPLSSWLKVAMRVALEAPRRLSTETRAQTDTSVIADVVLSGQAPRARIDYALGLYNLFDAQSALPTDPTFVTSTMPQPGRSLLVSLGVKLQ
jgi:outer membrane receptor for ferrienterochelin and colicins